jgi:hypothetical protein
VQYPHRVRNALAANIFKIPEHRIRVIANDIGGGFGTKGWQYPEHRLIPWAARKLRRPVKWTCDRSEAILADEPVASLDPVSARKVMELLVELNRRDGFGVIVTLHQVDYAIRYCDRVIALKAGEVVYDGPSTGLDTKQLIDIYGPEFEDAFWETKA